VPRRQLADDSHGTRHDLELAAWFGANTRGAGDEAIWADLAADPDLPTLRYAPPDASVTCVLSVRPARDGW
jgi:hypothetical protein